MGNLTDLNAFLIVLFVCHRSEVRMFEGQLKLFKVKAIVNDANLKIVFKIC